MISITLTITSSSSERSLEMAKSLMMMGFVMALVTVLPGLASAQSGCTAVILGLAPCLSYITGNSSTPSSSCCTQLARVVKSRPACLCSVLNGGASSLGITINQTRALAMPGACKVQTPPVSACSAVSSGPAAAPEASRATTPETPSTPSVPASPKTETPSPPSVPSSATAARPSTPSTPTAGSGSKATPSTTGATSDGSSYKPSSSLMTSVLYVAGCILLMANL
ncbi:non-specific lipid transfer protein GPI-anchored 5-like [Musa acuminata AAA Group]|uniref:non-specific lipid transfer protein GPI-anchored 5-like n=1 Tax=Musa acuminata AAA Group TaxID=214697 RepID=UPI0031D97964